MALRRWEGSKGERQESEGNLLKLSHKGKTHRVIKQTALLPRGRQRVHCGWRITKATSMVFWSSEVKDAALCRRCFPYLPPAPRQNEESIEDFEEAAPVQ